MAISEFGSRQGQLVPDRSAKLSANLNEFKPNIAD
jgi:hypothetical protein